VVTASVARLRADIERLKALASLERAIPADRVEFAHAVGIEEPDPWQERLLRSEAPRILLNITRQGGKSSMAGLLALHDALSVPDSLILILAPAERQAKETFSKAAAYYRALGHPVPADSHRKLGVELANGSRIEALPGTEKTVRGFSGVDLLILDEASRVDDGLYYAVRPMLAVSGGRLLMLTTPYGKRGVFYEEWTNGEGWQRYEVPASECPRISEEFLEEEREALPSWVYRQEYECSFEETEDVVFTYEMVARAASSEVAPLFGSG
jgi:hypothetical protein